MQTKEQTKLMHRASYALFWTADDFFRRLPKIKEACRDEAFREWFFAELAAHFEANVDDKK